VVRGPDIIWGGDIRAFHVPRGVFMGILGGSPCQDFSSIRRDAPTGYGVEMLSEFARVVTEAGPEWWILENVPRVPDLKIDGYFVQRFNVRASEFGGKQHRLRSFQFGSRDAAPIVLPRCVTNPVATEAAALASEGKKKSRRGWAEFCSLQGLDEPLELPGLTVAAKYKAVGNGVYVPLARVIARAIRDRCVTDCRVCICGCGRLVSGKGHHATASCRKIMQRRRDAAAVTEPGPVTRAASL